MEAMKIACNITQEMLEKLTPFDKACVNASVTACLLGSYSALIELLEEIRSVNALSLDDDPENFELLPIAEEVLNEMIASLPAVGDA